MKKLSENVWLVDPPNRNFPHSTSIFIKDEVNGLIDSATSEADFNFLKDQGIDILLGSHGHVDHALRNSEYPDARLLLNEKDHGYVASRDSFLKMLGSDIFGAENFNNMKIDRMGYRFRPADGMHFDGQRISFGKTEVEVMHLPGHTPGHTGFVFPREGFVFTADIDLEPFGPWYGNMKSSVDEFLNSLERLRRMGPDYIITGHAPEPFTSGIPKLLDSYRDVIFQRDKEIIRHLWSGKNTISEIAEEQPIFQGHPKRIVVFEFMMVWHHLKRLQRLGKVERDGDRFYLADGVRLSNLNLG
ncbi:MAG: MBL fold metallo-hydrolase [Syntrophomonadales bacterium]|jgi:glyoxylase-like metal-dependent hydrolase (beta-lactamase superfamily II)